jgi:hypothetical protein
MKTNKIEPQPNWSYFQDPNKNNPQNIEKWVANRPSMTLPIVIGGINNV